MRVALKILVCSAVLVLFALPASARSPRHDGHDGFGAGRAGGDAVVVESGPASAVPEPGAALVFGVGTLIIASRLRRQQSEQ